MAEHGDDERSTTNDSHQTDADDTINMAAIDNKLILSAQIPPADIVLHGGGGQGFSNINIQGQNSSFLPRSQGRTAGPADVQCTMLAVSDLPLSHTLTYTNSHTPLSTFTYDSSNQVETSASRNHTRKSNEQNPTTNTDILFDSCLDYTGKNTVSRENDDCSRYGVSTICDNLDTACFHKTVIQNSCCCDTDTQQSSIYDGCLDCLNTECTHSMAHKLYLARGLQKACIDANKDDTHIGDSSSVPAHLIIPSWSRLDNLLSRNQ